MSLTSVGFGAHRWMAGAPLANFNPAVFLAPFFFSELFKVACSWRGAKKLIKVLERGNYIPVRNAGRRSVIK